MSRKVVGKTVLEAFSQEEVGDFVLLLENVYQTGKPHIGKELPLSIPDEKGVIREGFLNISYQAFRKQTGEIKGVLAVHHDVTEQVLARKALEESKHSLSVEQNKLKAIFYSAVAPMSLFCGPDFIFEMVNSRYEGLVPGREFLGKTVLEALPEISESPFPKLLKTVFETGESKALLQSHFR